MSLRFTPSLEPLGERLNPSATATELTRQVSIVVEMSHELEGHECLVFYLGGIPDAGSGDMTMKGSKIKENAPADSGAGSFPALQPRAVDPTNPHLPAATPGPDDAELHRRNLVTLLSMDLDRPGSAPADAGYAGAHALYQDIFIPSASVDPSDPNDVVAGSAGSDAGDSFYGTGVYKSVDSGSTW